MVTLLVAVFWLWVKLALRLMGLSCQFLLKAILELNWFSKMLLASLNTPGKYWSDVLNGPGCATSEC